SEEGGNQSPSVAIEGGHRGRQLRDAIKSAIKSAIKRRNQETQSRDAIKRAWRRARTFAIKRRNQQYNQEGMEASTGNQRQSEAIRG
ncbi:hypothetical protein Ctob_007654, partial [Chrysochromulina tobinii]